MRRLRRSKRNILSVTAWRIRLALWGGAVLVGLSAVLFALAAEEAESFFRQLIRNTPDITLIITPAGLMLVAWLTHRFFPGAQGSGIPQTLAALEMRAQDNLRSTLISLRIVIGKILLTAIGLLSGASIGREGPTVHVGAAIMLSVGRWVRFPPHYMERSLIMAGGAAGISAAFNTPLAGVVFAIEEISRSFEQKTSGIVLTGVIFAGMTALILQGNYNYFGSTSAGLVGYHEWLVIPICGIVGGLAGGLFSQTLITGSRLLGPVARRRPLLLAGTCGVVVALVGIWSGNTAYGTGYDEAKAIIATASAADPLYPVHKFLASVASYLSGIPGGIFAPSLATGAGLGADLAGWFPEVSASAVIVLGMVGYFTGVVRTPITAFVIVMEMTDNHGMMLPLMATAFIADGVSKLVCPQPIYRALAAAFVGIATGPPTPSGNINKDRVVSDEAATGSAAVGQTHDRTEIREERGL